MLVSDIELTTPGGIGHVNTITKRPARLTDGLRHPVKVTKVSVQDMDKIWSKGKEVTNASQ